MGFEDHKSKKGEGRRGGSERERAACVRGRATRRKEGRMKEGMEMLKVNDFESRNIGEDPATCRGSMYFPPPSRSIAIIKIITESRMVIARAELFILMSCIVAPATSKQGVFKSG